ncbi:MAG TPA: amino acid ABC transporter permease [Desulfatiglandales bacterium]|nr:amino acid ABC transporter permease [Desulfatiglandales bacterium]
MRVEKGKITFLDIAIIAVLCLVAAYLAYRVTVGLNYKWNWAAIPQYLFRYDSEEMRLVPNLLMQGLFMTIRLSIWGTLIATIIGLIMGLFRVSPRLFRRLVGRTYVELIRNIPPIVLIFIFYYFISDQIFSLFDIDAFMHARSDCCQNMFGFFCAPVSQCSAFMSALITLAIFEGAYIAEIVRAGIQAIPKGQHEAAYALGMSRLQAMRHVILPQATKIILPPLAGQFISTIKDSAIVSVISIQELTFQGMELMSATYLTFECWIVITLLYLVLTLSLSLGVSRLEIKMRRTEA